MNRESIKQQISLAIKKLYSGVGLEDSDIDVTLPSKEEYAWNSKVAFKLAKSIGKSPKDIAEELDNELSSGIELQALGHTAEAGYLNFTLSPADYWQMISKLVTDGVDFSDVQLNPAPKWLIEHSSPNPNKAMHLGHLRNNVTGMAIANLWEAIGVNVIRDAVDNDRGIAIAKLMWGYLKFARKTELETLEDEELLNTWLEHPSDWLVPEDKGVRPDKFVDELYVKAAADFDKPIVEKIVRDFVVKWEAGDMGVRKLWELVMRFSHAGQDLTLQRLGNKWDKVWHESDHYQKGKDIVAKGLETGIFKRSEGAVVTDLAKYKIPDTVVEKSDGTSLYITQDLALTELKQQEFHADKMHWVIGPEQSLAMKQVFAVCDQLGIAKMEDCVHIAYGYMSIKGQGKMSSRAGNVVYIDDLIDIAKAEILEVMQQNGAEVADANATAEVLALAAVKYSILKVGRTTDTAFDLEESVSFNGNSGPYLVYTYARILALLEKAGVKVEDLKQVQEFKDKDHRFEQIARKISKFPYIVEQAALGLAPNFVATYLYELAQSFNAYYSSGIAIAKEEDEAVRFNRLSLSFAVAKTIQAGLNLLGIQTVDKM